MEEKMDVIEKIKGMVLSRKFMALAASIALLVTKYIEASHFVTIASIYMGVNLGEHFLNNRSAGNIQLSQKTVILKEPGDV